MRAAIDEVEVLASHRVLPATGETVELSLRSPGAPVVKVPALAEDPRHGPGVPPRLGRRIDRFTALAYRSVTELVEPLEMPPGDRVGVFFANTHAGWAYAAPQMDSLVNEGPRSVQPYFVTAWFPTAATGEVTIGLGFRGISKTTTGHVSGFAEALWLAWDAFERGVVDVAIVGAVESVVSSFALVNWPEERGLPTAGYAEGAVVFALRPHDGTTGCGAVLRNLRHDSADRTTDADDHWIPPLSIAAELAERTGSASAADGDVALGGGYRVTVTGSTRREHL